MNLLRLLVATLVVALSACSSPEPVQDPILQMREATRQLEAKSPADGTLVGFCSGVMVTKEYFITAAHCDLTGVAEMFVNGKKAVTVRKNEDTDVMVMHVPAGCPCVTTIATANLDDKVYAVGYPLEAGQVLTEGRSQGENKEGELLFTAAVTWGNSGGPVFVIWDGRPVLVAVVSRGTIIPLLGIFPVVIGHLNYGPGAAAIIDVFFDATGHPKVSDVR